MGKLPAEAFDAYCAMGEARSYAAVARKYGVSKRSITKRAAKEGWQQRLETIQRAARERADEQVIESLKAVHARHLRTLRAIQGKSLQALSSLPMTTAGEAARTMLAAMAQERDIYEIPGAEGSVTIQVITGVPERRDPDAELPALPAPRNGHDVRRPGVN